MRIWVQKVHFFKSFLKKPSKAKQWIKLKTKMWKGRVQFTERKKEAVSWYYWNPFECFSPFTYIYPFFLCSKIMYVAILNPLGGNRFRNFIWQLKLWQKNTKSISFHFHFQFSIRYRCIYRWQPLTFTYSKSNYSIIPTWCLFAWLSKVNKFLFWHSAKIIYIIFLSFKFNLNLNLADLGSQTLPF